MSETLAMGVLVQTRSIKEPSRLRPLQYSRPPQAVLPAEWQLQRLFRGGLGRAV